MADYYRTPDGFNINIQTVEQQSGIMKKGSANIYDVLEATQKRMRYMLDTKLWESDAARAIVEKFEALRPKIEEQRRDLAEFCKFLDKSVEHYRKTEAERLGDAGTVGG